MSIALEAELTVARVALAAAVAAAAVASLQLWTASATGGKDVNVPFGIAVALTNGGLLSIW